MLNLCNYQQTGYKKKSFFLNQSLKRKILQARKLQVRDAEGNHREGTH